MAFTTVGDRTLNQLASRLHYPGAWRQVGVAPNPPFDPDNDWGNVGSGFAPLRFRRAFPDRVQLDGFVVHAGGGGSGERIFTLPPGSRPLYDRVVTVQIGNGGLGYLYIQMNGDVTPTQVSGNITNGVFLDEVLFTIT